MNHAIIGKAVSTQTTQALFAVVSHGILFGRRELSSTSLHSDEKDATAAF